MENNPNNKKMLTLAGLVLVTIVLAVASIFIALQFRTSEPTPAPTDPGDSVGNRGDACPGGASQGFSNWGQCYDTCVAGADAQPAGQRDSWIAGCGSGCDNLCAANNNTGLQCPNGTGSAGGCLVFLCPDGCGTDGRCEGDDSRVAIYAENGSCNATLDGRCGQIDVMKGSGIAVDNAGSFCGVKEITCGTAACNQVITPTEVQCNQGCNGTTALCAAGLTCDNGVCRNSECSTDTDCTCDPDPSCGDGTVDAGETCDPAAATDTCSNGQICNNSCACENIPVDPVCGDTCNPSDPNACPQDHVCDDSTNTCILEGCTDGTCTSDQCSPICGGPCNPADASSCPNDHVCDPTSNTCVVTACLNDPTCTNNGCVIPVTAFLDGENTVDYLLVGMLLLVSGLVVLKFGNGIYLNFASTSRSISEPLSEENRNRRKTSKQRENFEEKFK